MRKVLTAVAAVLFLLISGTPAMAATTKVKLGSLCMRSGGYSKDYIVLSSCSVASTTVKLTDRPKYNGHRVVSIQFTSTKLCIDELGNTLLNGDGDVRVLACNSGNYQQFEVFNGSVSGTVVLKSLGAYVNKKIHACIQVDSRKSGSAMFWNDCGTGVADQQFKFA